MLPPIIQIHASLLCAPSNSSSSSSSSSSWTPGKQVNVTLSRLRRLDNGLRHRHASYIWWTIRRRSLHTCPCIRLRLQATLHNYSQNYNPYAVMRNHCNICTIASYTPHLETGSWERTQRILFHANFQLDQSTLSPQCVENCQNAEILTIFLTSDASVYLGQNIVEHLLNKLMSKHFSWSCGTVVERQSVIGELSMYYDRTAADGWPLTCAYCPLQGQPTRPTQPFILWGR